MNKQITIALPEAVYEQATSIADATHQPLDKVIQDALEQVFSPFPLHEKHFEMMKEVEAYKAMHPHLNEYSISGLPASLVGNEPISLRL